MKAPGNRQPTTTENSEPISSAIVKYNYQVDKTKKQPFWGKMDTIILNQHLDPPTQAQQLDELSLVKGSRVSWWANESSCDWKVFEYLQNHHLSCCPNISLWNQFMPIISSCPSRNVSLAQVMILEKSGDGWWRGQYGNKVFFYWPLFFFIGQYGNKVPATKPILAYSLNLRSAGFHRITHKRKSTTRTPTAWQRTSSTSWWNSNFPSNFLLGLSFPSLIPICFFLQVALYAFKAQADTELSFSKGDRLEVTLKQFTRYHESRLVYLQIFSGSRQTCIWPRMVQGKKPDGPGGDPSIVIIKFTIACKGGFGAVELPAGALPVPHPGRARWKERLGCTGGGNFFAKLTHFILRRQMVEQQMATERLARKFRASLGTTVRSGRGWMEPHSVFFICLTIPFFYSRGECDAIMDQKGQDGDFLVSINKFFFFCRLYKDIFLNITNVK